MCRERLRVYALAGATAFLPAFATGCMRSMSPLSEHTLAFSKAAILVTNASADAYTSANQLHSDEQIARAVVDYDKSTSWDPDKYATPLLSDEQLQSRRQVLDGLKTYAETLGELTHTKSRPELDDAARSLGSNLQQLSSTVTTSFGTKSELSISDSEKSVLSTALAALGDYLQQRTISRRLPVVLRANDPTVGAICDVLIADVRVLRRQADKDYDELEIAQDEFIRHAQPPLAADQRRTEIAKLPAMVREQQQNELLLRKLEQSLGALKATHHALATTAQDSNPGSLRLHIAELTADGQSLLDSYQNLNNKQCIGR